MADIRYRNELKYLISDNEAQIITHELEPLLKIDGNARDGKYVISSLYFDGIDDDDYYDVDAGIDEKRKFRIRIYDHSDSFIRLERKNKKNAMTAKESCKIDRKTAEKLMAGEYLRDIDKLDEVEKELSYLIMAKGYRPKIIVDYERIPFIYKFGNVRITLDMNICSSSDLNSFLDGFTYRRPILPIGKHLLEVKYDEYMPKHIYDCLNDLNLQQISFSKYYLCRQYNVKGGLFL